MLDSRPSGPLIQDPSGVYPYGSGTRHLQQTCICHLHLLLSCNLLKIFVTYASSCKPFVTYASEQAKDAV